MRYRNVPDIIFNDKQGRSFTVKDIRPIPDYENILDIKVEKGMFLDELISRKEYYDDDNEGLAYAMVDHNRVKMVENDFDISKLQKIRLPKIDGIF